MQTQVYDNLFIRFGVLYNGLISCEIEQIASKENFGVKSVKKRFENKLLHSLVLRRVEGVNSSFKARRHYLMSLYDGMSTDHYLIRVVLVIRYGRENVSPKYI